MYWRIEGTKTRRREVSKTAKTKTGERERESERGNATNLFERELRLPDLDGSEKFLWSNKKQVPEGSSSLEVGFGRVVDERLDALLKGEDVSKDLSGRQAKIDRSVEVFVEKDEAREH